ncbi:unnamed protein product [Heligmosomoides polygyrus]|uniref:Endo/exonuclease/phosphatase domain-containing protein n=1 Tax=Heligmosomoides polygyrus TaxID=6339 RepID=A0A3P8DV86_HELPZ|nr:unnamed protein product [Heligmosomoides polygyrus]
MPTIDRLSKFYNIFYSNKDYLYYTAILVSKMFDVERWVRFRFGRISAEYFNCLRVLLLFSGMKYCRFVENLHLLKTMFICSLTRKNRRAEGFLAEYSPREYAGTQQGEVCSVLLLFVLVLGREQFKICMEKIQEIITRYPNCLLFFGGDLNIRDDEVANVPRGVADAWLAAGAKGDTEFTWDTRKNDNKHSFGARNRFDRIIWYGPLRRVKFALAGQQRIRSCLCFPSDHWAVHCEFS